MSFEGNGRWSAVVETCRYAPSRMAFRGPKHSLQNEYLAFLGGTETYGKFVERPFPELIEEATGVSCVNLGLPNAGVAVMLTDPGLVRIASGAQLTVVQVPCAANFTNPFYKVHPRRNDRFVKAEEPLREMYPEVDFTDFSFTRHMLVHLRRTAPERFAALQEGLAAAWVDGMRRLIAEIRGPVALLWFSARRPEQHFDDIDLRYEPALVSREMLQALERDNVRLVEVDLKMAWRGGGAGEAPSGPGPDLVDQPMARDMPGPLAHQIVAEALIPVVAEVLDP